MTARRATPGPDVTASRSWRARLDDPDEPLYTVAVAADLLGVGTQALRRLGEALDVDGQRPSGNQRRYSRNDLERLSRAQELQDDGHAATSITRIMELEQQVGDRPTRRRR
ncbi:MAG TPA: MerR family transcriptional regulator [Iamia sp.]|nr:MerR family transcriptional regulator [Iamia sp.]